MMPIHFWWEWSWQRVMVDNWYRNVNNSSGLTWKTKTIKYILQFMKERVVNCFNVLYYSSCEAWNPNVLWATGFLMGQWLLAWIVRHPALWFCPRVRVLRSSSVHLISHSPLFFLGNKCNVSQLICWGLLNESLLHSLWHVICFVF